MNNNIYYNKINIEGGNGFRSIVFAFTSYSQLKHYDIECVSPLLSY